MPKPTNKAELFAAIDKERAALEKQFAALTDDQIIEPGTVGEWSVKDVMAHLIAWEGMVRDWYEAGKRGEDVETPAPGYKWSETPLLNHKIYEQYRDVALTDIRQQFAESYTQTRAMIESIDDEVLFQRGLWKWMRNNALGAYFTSCTSSHYKWARTEIRKGLKAKVQ